MAVQAERYRSCLSSPLQHRRWNALSSTRWVNNAASPPLIRAFGDFLRHRLLRSRSTSRCFLCRLLLFPARFGSRRLLRASSLQAFLQDGNQINHFGWLGGFLRLLLNFFSAGFHFFFDHFHECLAVVVLIFFRVPF